MKAQDFWQIYNAIYPRRWLLAALLGATLTLVAVVCAATPRFYRASASVMPSEAALTKPVIPGTGSAFSQSVRSADSSRLEEQLATLIGLAKTGEVRQRAIRNLHLGVNSSQLEPMVTAELWQGNIIRISALSKSPDGAVKLANEIAHQFTSYYRDISSYQARQNRAFYEELMKNSESEMNRSKAELQVLKTTEGEAALPVGTAENPFLKQFYQLRADIDATRSQLDEVNGRLWGVEREWKGQKPTTRTTVGTSPDLGVESAQAQLNEIDRNLASARAKYTEKHRVIQDLLARRAETVNTLETAQNRVLTKDNPLYAQLRDRIPELRTERDALKQRLTSLQRSMTENEQRAAKLADSSVILAAKAGDYDSAKARYEQLKQYVEAAIMEERVSSTRGEIQVVDEAKSADGPVTKGGPTLGNLILLGLLLSLGLSFGTVAALSFLDSRVRERQDLQKELGLPVPTVVPIGLPDAPGQPVARVTQWDPTSAHAEAYRYLRAQLLYQKGGTPVRVVLIATARPAQGGTTTAANLALALAEVGQRVILVDCDLRRPSLHRLFGQENEYGLTDLLQGGTEFDRALLATEAATLRLLPAGTKVDNPAALLNSGAMGKLLATLRAEADYVVIDGPSLGAFADSMMLGPLVDGVLLVARANQSLGRVEAQAKEMLERVGANIIGAVLNAASPDRVSNWYFHQHYYGAPAAPPAPSAAPTEAPPPAAPEQAGALGFVRRNLRNILMGVGAVGLALVMVRMTTQPAIQRPAGAEARAGVQAGAVQPGLTVTADVLRPTKARITRDGEVLLDGDLAVGKQEWKADRTLEIWAERPEALVVSVNGKPGQALGEAGSLPATRVFSTDDSNQQDRDGAEPMINALTFDLEDWFQVSNLEHLIPFARWEECESRLERNTRRVLEMLARAEVRATFFVLGWNAERFPRLVREVAEAGHEIASHGYAHRLVYEQTPEEFAADLERATRAIGEACGVRPRSYRAPSFSITPRSAWAFAVLAEAGFTTDASVFPIFHERYGFQAAPRVPHRVALPNGAGLLEAPPSTLRLAGRNYPFAGGAYFRLLPYAAVRRFGRRLQAAGEPLVCYFHPWEFDPGIPRFRLSPFRTLRSYVNLDRTEARLGALLQDFRFGTLSQLLAGTPVQQTWAPPERRPLRRGADQAGVLPWRESRGPGREKRVSDGASR